MPSGCIAPLVESCHVLNVDPVHLRGNKTDKWDARKLLQVVTTSVITDTLHCMPTVFVPPEKVTRLRTLFSTYRLMKKMGTQLRNRDHSISRENGIVIDREELAAYLGTVPPVRASNPTPHLGPVSKCGRSLTVSPLTQSVVHLKAAAAYYILRRGTEFLNKNEVNFEHKHK